MNKDELATVLDELKREDELRSAFIAGVRKGVEVACDNQRYNRGELDMEIRAAFQNWLDDRGMEKKTGDGGE